MKVVRLKSPASVATANRLRPVIDRSFPLQEIGEAFRYSGSGKHLGKICLELYR